MKKKIIIVISSILILLVIFFAVYKIRTPKYYFSYDGVIVNNQKYDCVQYGYWNIDRKSREKLGAAKASDGFLYYAVYSVADGNVLLFTRAFDRCELFVKDDLEQLLLPSVILNETNVNKLVLTDKAGKVLSETDDFAVIESFFALERTSANGLELSEKYYLRAYRSELTGIYREYSVLSDKSGDCFVRVYRHDENGNTQNEYLVKLSDTLRGSLGIDD